MNAILGRKITIEYPHFGVNCGGAKSSSLPVVSVAELATAEDVTQERFTRRIFELACPPLSRRVAEI
jgi:hypothetical protein